jgi:uncharacterized protein (TIGR00266 family)
MQVNLRHNPSFTIARLLLAPNEPVRVESGAMAMHSPGMKLESRSSGGVMQGIKRSVLAGESFFTTTYTAPQQGGWVDVAGVLPGDIMPIDIQPDRPYYLSRGNWLANSYGTEIETKWGGRANLFGGEGGFGLHCHGQGTAVVSVFACSAPSTSLTCSPVSRSWSTPATWSPTTSTSSSGCGARSRAAPSSR